MDTRFTVLLLTASLAVSACKKSESDKAKGETAAGKSASTPGEAAPAEAPATTKPQPKESEYASIDGVIDGAKTPSDFNMAWVEALKMCGELVIEQRKLGNDELERDPTYREHCKLRPVRSMAKLAIDAKDRLLGVVADGELDTLAKEGFMKADEANALRAQVKQACGL